MLNAIIAGGDDPERLADLAKGTARKKRSELVEAFRGHVTAHYRTMLKLHFDRIAAFKSALEQVDAAVGKALAPISHAADLLKTIPGITCSATASTTGSRTPGFDRLDKTRAINRLIGRLHQLGCHVAVTHAA